MPKVLKKFEFTGGVGAESTYDWETLLDGKIYAMVSGEDFECKEATFATLVRNAARKAGKTVKTQKQESDDGKVTIVIQAEAASKEQIATWAQQDADKKAAKKAEKEAAKDRETEEVVEE